MLASGQASAQALARSRTMEALVLKRSNACVQQDRLRYFLSVRGVPSRVMPGFRGTPAGISTISEPVRAFFRPSASG